MSEVSDTLRAARKLIEKPENWCKGAYARDPGGTAVHQASRDACAWCVWGAVGIAADMVDANLDRATKALGPALPAAFRGVSDFNDHPDTTHPMVLDLLTRAIAMEEADG